MAVVAIVGGIIVVVQTMLILSLHTRLVRCEHALGLRRDV